MRALIYWDGDKWFVRRVACVTMDTTQNPAGEKVYRCDAPMGGPYKQPNEAVHCIMTHVSAEREKSGPAWGKGNVLGFKFDEADDNDAVDMREAVKRAYAYTTQLQQDLYDARASLAAFEKSCADLRARLSAESKKSWDYSHRVMELEGEVTRLKPENVGPRITEMEVKIAELREERDHRVAEAAEAIGKYKRLLDEQNALDLIAPGSGCLVERLTQYMDIWKSREVLIGVVQKDKGDLMASLALRVKELGDAAQHVAKLQEENRGLRSALKQCEAQRDTLVRRLNKEIGQ